MGDNSNNIGIEPVQQKSFFDQVFSFALAFVPADDPEVVAGEEIEVPIEFTATESSYGFGEYRVIVEVYDCQDSSCDNGQFIESRTFGNLFSYITEGQTYTTSVNYEVPSTLNGDFQVVSYIWDANRGEKVSTASTTQYTVVDPDSGTGDEKVDSDNDGTIDSEDECPDTYGEKDNGCPIQSNPDSDGDGVVDSEDACTYTFGSGVDGCPVDSDNDGINDIHDQCENTAGPESNNGCPVNDNNDNQNNLNTQNLGIAAFVVLFGTALLVYYRYG